MFTRNMIFVLLCVWVSPVFSSGIGLPNPNFFWWLLERRDSPRRLLRAVMAGIPGAYEAYMQHPLIRNHPDAPGYRQAQELVRTPDVVEAGTEELATSPVPRERQGRVQVEIDTTELLAWIERNLQAHPDRIGQIFGGLAGRRGIRIVLHYPDRTQRTFGRRGMTVHVYLIQRRDGSYEASMSPPREPPQPEEGSARERSKRARTES